MALTGPLAGDGALAMKVWEGDVNKKRRAARPQISRRPGGMPGLCILGWPLDHAERAVGGSVECWPTASEMQPCILENEVFLDGRTANRLTR